MQVSNKGRVESVMELMQEEFPPISYPVYPLIPEGLTLLAGSPKVGKSWVALQLCLAVASGGYAFGKLPVEQNRVLYLALEDSRKRLQHRIQTLEAPENLELFDFAGKWPTLGDGGAEELDKHLTDFPDTKLVVIDTLKMFKGKSSGGNQNAYDVDYESVRPLLEVAHDHNTAIVAIHHTRKERSESDPHLDISGSTGLTGGVDSIVMLERERYKSNGVIRYDGRDIEEPGELAIEWDHLIAGWKIVADTSQFFKLSPERQLIYEAVFKAGTASPREVAGALSKNESTIKNTMQNMEKSGHLAKADYRRYRVAETT